MILKEELEQEYQRISFWINNLDTKISFALGASGVLLGFILSNQDLGESLKRHLKTLKFWNESLILFLLFGVTVALLVISLWFFLNGLKAKIDSKKYHQSQMVSLSNIFWGDISKNNFYSYKYRLEYRGDKDWKQDMMTQIYINSCICTQKSKLYNRGITTLKLSLICFVFYHIWIWFFI